MSQEFVTVQIIDVTEELGQDESQGEVLMEDLANQMETVVTFPSELESTRRIELAGLSKQELIEIIIERERDLRKRSKMVQRLRHQQQDKTKMARQGSSSSIEPEVEVSDGPSTSQGFNVEERRGKKRKAENGRELDFSAYGKRHVALRFLYLGWNYQGYVVQDGIDSTIEDHIFAALAKTKLIQSRQTSRYHRCGRTDKSVSAFSQVISLQLRSTATSGPGVIEPASPGKASSNEIAYVQMLNGVLPKNIRILAWCPVEPDFSARFSCAGRKYRYFFPRANLDIDRMNQAAQLLRGEHDFRNFCRADINGGVTNYFRRIDEIFVEDSVAAADTRTQYDICGLHVYGSAFLWHQVRSIVALLFLVGQRKEEPEMITDLLDVQRQPAKPQYTMAEGFPLVLFDCDFPDLTWQYDESSMKIDVRELEKLWTCHAVKTAMIGNMVKSVKGHLMEMNGQDTDYGNLLHALLPEGKGRAYQPLKDRRTCDTIESRLLKKMKLNDVH